MIEPDTIYTSKETAKLLKISQSTFKRLLKKGLIRANKVGGQYRVLGHEILQLVSPKVDEKASNIYQRLKAKTKEFLEE
jgi:excisionase family DNA binding protein